MKIRQGFVSNSSSSSFVLVVEREWFKQCLEEGDEYLQHVVKSSGLEPMQVLGIPCIVIEGWYDYGESFLTLIEQHSSEKQFWDDRKEEWLTDITAIRDKAFDKFEQLVSRKKDKVFCHTKDD